jgi:hypothetical protein
MDRGIFASAERAQRPSGQRSVNHLGIATNDRVRSREVYWIAVTAIQLLLPLNHPIDRFFDCPKTHDSQLCADRRLIEIDFP